MNRLSNNSIVDRTEAAALKDMIFQRARERAEALNESVKEVHTTNAHSDIMDIARSSFESAKNPFSIINKTSEVITNESKSTSDNIGFPPRKSEIASKIVNKNKEAFEEFSKATVEESMTSVELSRRQSFTGALNFLNTQATISLANSRAKRFDTFA